MRAKMDYPRTLEAFRATGTQMSSSEFIEQIVTDLSDVHCRGKSKCFWVYAGACYITEEALNPLLKSVSVFSLRFQNKEYVGTKEYLEARLYFDWYVIEVVDRDHWDLAMLGNLLDEYAAWKDALLQEAEPRKYGIDLSRIPAPLSDSDSLEWLEWLVQVWDEAKTREISYGGSFEN